MTYNYLNCSNTFKRTVHTGVTAQLQIHDISPKTAYNWGMNGILGNIRKHHRRVIKVVTRRTGKSPQEISLRALSRVFEHFVVLV